MGARTPGPAPRQFTKCGKSSHGDGWCNATFDSILCWPPTAPSTEQLLPCPPFKGVDPNKFARRYCLEDGIWRGRTHHETLVGGWTNYSDCFIPEVKKLMDQLYSSSGDDAGVRSIAKQPALV
ncbi:Calcitonin receptor-like protein 1 [Amphibalanus amphitrite]|uniref:Calcitonin receptor-like protein 1 n=1 Tax=Amphibalanus amphitrite TaxID=1232801 RepID=A0A6A4VST4_AMPAM|nr:Calcitonin receptor-like protein 1 [Amphibalanus amphitrite]